jgi:LEA14-like dessication related protein
MQTVARTPRRTLLGLLLGVSLGGCSLFLPKLTTPHLSLESLEWSGGDLVQQHFRARVRVQNPNDRALPVKGLSYTLYVFGDEFAQGESAASFTVPALGEAEFEMNVTTNAAGAMLRLLTHPDQRSKPIDYRLVGRVELSSGVLRSVPFEQQGSFSLR